MGVLFTLTAHDGTTGWKKQIEHEDILPKIEVARFFWEPDWADSYGICSSIVKRPNAHEHHHDYLN
jgi:hypothetical protein